MTIGERENGVKRKIKNIFEGGENMGFCSGKRAKIFERRTTGEVDFRFLRGGEPIPCRIP
jgi:hypothetical protein